MKRKILDPPKPPDSVSEETIRAAIQTASIMEVPPVVGSWRVCGQDLYFNLTKRPSKWNQFWCALLIGWKWYDR